MFVITNRRIEEGRGVKQFGSRPNAEGPNELRLFEAVKQARGWKINLLEDQLTPEQKAELELPKDEVAYASQYVAKKVLDRVRTGKRDLVFFIHGFNNDVQSVLERAHGFEQKYGVEVISFSWPANGGGVKGVASYKDDKRDARASSGAVYRALKKTREYLDQFNSLMMQDVLEKATKKFPDNLELRQQHISLLAEKACPFRVTLLAHSMGNYLFKQIQASSTYDEHHMLFDNVILAAADTNNDGHPEWVDRIRCRRKVYITINEDDGALCASRIKAGEEQRARLGHYLHGLYSSQALYVDVTDAPRVGKDHAYFEGKPVENEGGRLFKFFNAALHGERAEEHLKYRPATSTWRA